MIRRAAFVPAAVALALAPPSVRAGGDPVVVTAGAHSLRASEVERRLAAVPDFQRATLGTSESAIRRTFVDSVVVPELLAAQAARDQKLAEHSSVRARVQDTLRQALDADLLQETRRARPVTEEDIAKYYDAHRGDYHSDPSIQIWRILVADEALARRILDQARGAGGPDRWKALAREHSVDQATSLRGGSLGFVSPNGATDVPQLRVDSALYDAASKVADGDLVPEPVREGGRFAVVWRRGHLPPVDRPLSAEAPAIRMILERERLSAARTALLERLRREHLSEVHADLLEDLPPSSTAPPRPERTPEPAASRSASDPAPKQMGSGLR